MQESLLGKRAAQKFIARLEFGDSLLALYLAVIVRQYFWWGGASNLVAWIFSCVVALAIGYLYVAAKEPVQRIHALSFWIVVGLPLFVFYTARVAFPDLSFDVLNYHLLQGERSLRGFLFRADDFFPTPAPFNPTPDMVTGLARFFLGYRLGTLINLFATFWAAAIVDKLLRPTLANAWQRASAVLFVVLAEHLLFEINNHMIDLLGLPLLLEATWLSLRNLKAEGASARLATIALLLGLSVAFKLTNIACAVPIMLVCAYDLLVRRGVRLAEFLKVTLLSFTAFVAPLLPFTIYSELEMGSPFYPFVNGFFESPFWGAHNGWDPRWGPHGWWETLSWPIRTVFVPERLSELSLYSGRITLGFVCALTALFLVRRDTNLRTLCLIAVGGLLAWGAITGYVRYALYFEMITGVILVSLVVLLAREVTGSRNVGRRSLAALIGLAMLAQTAMACRYAKKREWSDRSTFFNHGKAWKREARHFLRDRSLEDFLTPSDRALFEPVQVWVDASVRTNGIAVLLKEEAPVIGLRNPENFATPIARARFAGVLDLARDKRMYSLCWEADVPEAIQLLRDKGFTVGAEQPVMFPFYSPDLRLGLVLIEVLGAKEVANGIRPEPTK